MKRILLAVIAIVVIGVSSCKKEEGAQPESKTSAAKVLNKKDTQQWD